MSRRPENLRSVALRMILDGQSVDDVDAHLRESFSVTLGELVKPVGRD